MVFTKMNSIITAIKNRTIIVDDGIEKPIYKKSIESLVGAYHLQEEMELVLVDFGSTDTDYQWIKDKNINANKIVVNEEFNLGKGRNIGAMAARGDKLFFLDADMLYPTRFFDACMENLNGNIVYCPISIEERSGEWLDAAMGNIILKKEQFEKIGRWEERNTWGREDSEFFNRAIGMFKTKRERLDGFIHQSHNIMWDRETLKWKH